MIDQLISITLIIENSAIPVYFFIFSCYPLSDIDLNYTDHAIRKNIVDSDEYDNFKLKRSSKSNLKSRIIVWIILAPSLKNK